MQKHYAYFSAAIRDGAKLRPQAFGAPEYRPREGTSCVIEAGAHAMRGRFREATTASFYRYLSTAYPYLLSFADCPAAECTTYGREVLNLCWHLNDTHEWTREAIADWLYVKEEKLGFVTVVETQDYCDTRDNDLNKDSQASLPEKVFV